MLTRRSIIGGLFAAPAIVSFANIMPVRALTHLLPPDNALRLADFTYDGFWYINAAGEKFSGNPECLLSATIKNGKIVEQSSKSVTAFYKHGTGHGFDFERVGVLNDADHALYIDNLHKQVASYGAHV